MELILTAGDRVIVNSKIEPKLVFVVDEVINIVGQPMACGKYGCFAVDLLRIYELPVKDEIHKTKCQD